MKRGDRDIKPKEDKIIETLANLAFKWEDKHDFGYSLASALIYANLAEFFAQHILISITANIKTSLMSKKCNLSFLNKNKRTDLDSTIKSLENYKFPDDNEIIKLLNKIKNSRNNLIHGLLEPHKRGFNIDITIKLLQHDTKTLLMKSLTLDNTINSKILKK